MRDGWTWRWEIMMCAALVAGCSDDTTVVGLETGTESGTGETTETTDPGTTGEGETETETGLDETETGETGEPSETSETETETGCEGEGCACETADDCDPGLECDEGVCVMPDPAQCGDGIVEGDEQCDDGNEIDTDACTNLCTEAVCGDGIVWDDNEICDDGNEIEGDGCNSDCVESASLLEATIIDGGEGNDQAYAVAFDIEGNFIIAGRVFRTGQSCDLWVGKFEPDGSSSGACHRCSSRRPAASPGCPLRAAVVFPRYR